MLRPVQLTSAVTLIALICLLTRPSAAQEDLVTLPGAASRFAAAERAIENKADYWTARETLAQKAVRLVEEDPSSKDAEEVLQWVLESPRSSPAGMQAAKLLAQHHATSKSTIQWLLNLRPREWTPNLFATILKADLAMEDRALVEFSQAIHDCELLELSDEIKASKGERTEYELRLGKTLTDELRKLDGDEFGLQLIETLERLIDRHGQRVYGGATVRELAGGAIFAIKHLRLGKTASGLAGTTLDNKSIALEQYRGNVVLIDFWATWCAPCVGEMPHLKQLKSKHQDRKLVILGVNEDESKEDVERFVEKHAIDWPIILDADGTLQRRWMALSLPAYCVLDQDQVIRYRGRDFNQAASVIESIVGQDSVAQMVSLTLQALDKNNDRRIEKGELTADQQAVMATADLDKDGFLSVEELTSFTRANLKTTTVDPDGNKQ